MSDQYLMVLREFVAIAGGDPQHTEADTEVCFEHDGMLAYFYLHPQEPQLVVDVEIMQLSEPAAEPRNLERMVLLHQLNSLTRFTHGALVHFSPDQMLVLSRSYPLESLTGQKVAEQAAELLDYAANLRASWDALGQLMANTLASAGTWAGAGVQASPGQFA